MNSNIRGISLWLQGEFPVDFSISGFYNKDMVGYPHTMKYEKEEGKSYETKGVFSFPVCGSGNAAVYGGLCAG